MKCPYCKRFVTRTIPHLVQHHGCTEDEAVEAIERMKMENLNKTLQRVQEDNLKILNSIAKLTTCNKTDHYIFSKKLRELEKENMKLRQEIDILKNGACVELNLDDMNGLNEVIEQLEKERDRMKPRRGENESRLS